jgi:metallophosphoesterase superfamily enzyme
MRVLEDWLLTPERVALHLPSATGVLADPHLGYEEARCAAGEAVPARSLEDQLAPLLSAFRRHGLHRLVIAGDLLEDRRCQGMAVELCRWLDRSGVELLALVPGNHDHGPGDELAPGLVGLPVFEDGMELGTWRVVHGHGSLPLGRLVHGHEHPWLRWTDQLSAPCYLVGRGRLVLPAFSEEAAGVNVLGVCRWGSYRCCVIAGDRVLDFGDLATLRSRMKRARGRGQ